MSCTSTHCVTCGDDGVEMTVDEVDERRGLAVCTDADGERHTVETALVEPVAPGDRLLVHAGTAIAALVPAAADPAGPDGVSASHNSRTRPPAQEAAP